MQGCCCGKLKSGYIHHLGADAPARRDHRRPGDFPQSRGKGRQPGLCPGAAGLPRCHGGRGGPGRRRGHLAGKPPGGGGGLLLRGPPGGAHRPGLHHRGQRRGKRHHHFGGGQFHRFPGGCGKAPPPVGAGGLFGAPAGNPPGDRGVCGQAGALLGKGGHLGPGPRPWPPAPGSCWPCAITSSPTRQSWPCSPGCPPPPWNSARQPHASCWPKGWARCWCLWGPKGPWP